MVRLGQLGDIFVRETVGRVLELELHLQGVLFILDEDGVVSRLAGAREEAEHPWSGGKGGEVRHVVLIAVQKPVGRNMSKWADVRKVSWR